MNKLVNKQTESNSPPASSAPPPPALHLGGAQPAKMERDQFVRPALLPKNHHPPTGHFFNTKDVVQLFNISPQV